MPNVVYEQLHNFFFFWFISQLAPPVLLEHIKSVRYKVAPNLGVRLILLSPLGHMLSSQNVTSLLLLFYGIPVLHQHEI